MLVLERRVGEVIIIGDDIHIQVIAVRGKIVRIGVTAPTSTTVYRREVYERIRQGRARPIRARPDPGPDKG
jgi:carbon storage regulator